MIELTGTGACIIRDELRKKHYNNEITLAEITERLYNIDMPDWLVSGILEMTHYRQYDRITDSVEQAMEAAVHRKIVSEILKEEKVS